MYVYIYIYIHVDEVATPSDNPQRLICGARSEGGNGTSRTKAWLCPRSGARRPGPGCQVADQEATPAGFGSFISMIIMWILQEIGGLSLSWQLR